MRSGLSDTAYNELGGFAYRQSPTDVYGGALPAKQELKRQRDRITQILSQQARPSAGASIGTSLANVGAALGKRQSSGEMISEMQGKFQADTDRQIGAEQEIGNTLKAQAMEGQEDAKAVDDAIMKATGGDPALYSKVAAQLQSDPEGVGVHNAIFKANQAASQLGIDPFKVGLKQKEEEFKLSEKYDIRKEKRNFNQELKLAKIKAGSGSGIADPQTGLIMGYPPLSSAPKSVQNRWVASTQKELEDSGKKTADAQIVLENLDLFEDALSKLPSGKVAPIKGKIGQWMAGAGMGKDAAAAAYEVMQSVSDVAALKQREPGTGVMTDKDFEVFKRVVIDPAKTTGFNKTMIDYTRLAKNRQLERDNFIQEYSRQTGGHTQGARAAWQAYLDENPLFNKDGSKNMNVSHWSEWMSGYKPGEYLGRESQEYGGSKDIMQTQQTVSPEGQVGRFKVKVL